VRLHVRVVPILLIGLLHWALILLTNCTYNVPITLSVRYIPVDLLNDGQTRFADVPSFSKIVDVTQESHT